MSLWYQIGVFTGPFVKRELFRHMADASQLVDNICTLGEVDLQSPHLHVQRHWVSWNEPLVSDRRVHWAICERELFRHMADASQLVDNICTLGEVDLQSLTSMFAWSYISFP